jgi:large conductance mechanosensitive channel
MHDRPEPVESLVWACLLIIKQKVVTFLYLVRRNDFQQFKTSTKNQQPMWNEFKAFILRGNVLELAVAVIVAGAFGAIVTSFTNDIIMPPLGMLLGGVDFSALALTLQAAEMAEGEVVKEAVQIRYGIFIQRIIDFLIIAFAIFMLLKAYKASQKPIIWRRVLQYWKLSIA